MLEVYIDKYNNFSDVNRKKKSPKYDSNNLMIDAYEYKNWNKEDSEDSTIRNVEEKLDDLPLMLLLEGDGLKNFYSKQIINQTSGIVSTNKS